MLYLLLPYNCQLLFFTRRLLNRFVFLCSIKPQCKITCHYDFHWISQLAVSKAWVSGCEPEWIPVGQMGEQEITKYGYRHYPLFLLMQTRSIGSAIISESPTWGLSSSAERRVYLPLCKKTASHLLNFAEVQWREAQLAAVSGHSTLIKSKS